MRNIFPLLTLFLGFFGAGLQVRASSETTFVTEKKEGILSLSNSAWGDFGISLSASRAWGKDGFRGNKKLLDIPENSPGKITIITPFIGPLEEEMTVKLAASTSGSRVDFATTLESSAQLPAVYYVNLSVPIETARDLTVLADDKPLTTDLQRAGVCGVSTIISLVKTSTGQNILNITGEFGSVRTHFFAGHPSRPLTVSFGPENKPSDSSASFTFPFQFDFGNP